MIRRVFLSRFPALAIVRGSYGAEQARGGASSWTPARHEQDDWLDANTAKHRVVVDTFTADRFPDGLQFSGNLFETNLAAYDVAMKDMAVLLVVRHNTTPFGYNDAMWAKYGKQFTQRMGWVDPKTKEVPTANVYAARFAALAKNGLMLGVCQRTTRAYSTNIAREFDKKPEEIYSELAANLIVAGAHIVPAGVICVTRAQERGYSLVTIG
jgi:intracellular sulfur oxidation DsrE/DsrF family protein